MIKRQRELLLPVVAILLSAFFAGCSAGSAEDVSITIRSPEEDALLEPGPITVSTRLEGATVTSEGAGHVHLMVDGEMMKMTQETTMEVVLDRGKHTIMAEYVDAAHKPLEPRVMDRVHVTVR